ncbi:unnamed protein product, partial [Timema podura]|nr:unnamed protein product [Timema podura]
TWTGQSGALRPSSSSLPRFGRKKVTEDAKKPVSSATAPPGGTMSSEELLSRMRHRNRLLSPLSDQAESTCAPPSDEHTELLTDIRNYVWYGGTTSGRATTAEIIQQFQERLPQGSSPLFKFLLQEVCEFHRLPSGEGVWQLRAEFKR